MLPAAGVPVALCGPLYSECVTIAASGVIYGDKWGVNGDGVHEICVDWGTMASALPVAGYRNLQPTTAITICGYGGLGGVMSACSLETGIDTCKFSQEGADTSLVPVYDMLQADLMACALTLQYMLNVASAYWLASRLLG